MHPSSSVGWACNPRPIWKSNKVQETQICGWVNVLFYTAGYWGRFVPSCRPSVMFPDFCHSVSLQLWKDSWLKTWVPEPRMCSIHHVSTDSLQVQFIRNSTEHTDSIQYLYVVPKVFLWKKPITEKKNLSYTSESNTFVHQLIKKSINHIEGKHGNKNRRNLSAHVKIDLVFISLQLIAKLQEKCNLLPSSHKKALSADFDEIMYTTTGDVGIYYDDNGQHQVLTSQNI